MLFFMSFSAESPPAGWYPDPAGSGGQRYWDGGSWSQVTRPVDGMAGGQPPQQQQTSVHSSYGQGSSTQNMAYGQAPHGQGMARQPVLAGFWWRVLATILDGLVLALPLSLLQTLVLGNNNDLLAFWTTDYLTSMIEGTIPPPLPDGVLTALILSGIVTLLAYIAYRTVLVATHGGTVGQLITGLRVVLEDSPVTTKPSWGTSGLRAVTAVVFQQIPVLNLVDVLLMLGSSKKQTLHDRVARTIVIKK